MFVGINEEYLSVLANDVACIINNYGKYTKKNPPIHAFRFVTVPYFKNHNVY